MPDPAIAETDGVAARRARSRARSVRQQIEALAAAPRAVEVDRLRAGVLPRSGSDQRLVPGAVSITFRMTDTGDASEFPTRFPIFPLPGVVLFPGTYLPLHIFEPRYRALTEAALAGDQVIGMVLIRGDQDAMQRRAPIFSVGCAGRIVERAPSRWAIQPAAARRAPLPDPLRGRVDLTSQHRGGAACRPASPSSRRVQR
jgi:hypothetical protein